MTEESIIQALNRLIDNYVILGIPRKKAVTQCLNIKAIQETIHIKGLRISAIRVLLERK